MDKHAPDTATRVGKRWRFRMGIRVQLGVILVLALLLGWVADLQRQVLRREAVVAEVGRDGLIVNHDEPTYLCLIAMKVLGTDSQDVIARCSRWLGHGWFLRPLGFNAGRKLSDEQVLRVVSSLQKLGTVHEVSYHGPTLNGLRLFYIDSIPYGQLGPEGESCTFQDYPDLAARPAP